MRPCEWPTRSARSSWRCATTASAARTRAPARASAAWPTGWERATARSASRARPARARWSAPCCRSRPRRQSSEHAEAQGRELARVLERGALEADRGAVGQAHAGAQQHGGDVHDDLVEQPALEALPREAGAEDLEVAALAGGRARRRHGGVDAVGEERDARVLGVLRRPVGEHEDRSLPPPAVDAGAAVVARRRRVVPAA